MAKPDWGELQQRFLSDHAATGVSPKDWCEAQGLNYATARRYIKKPTAQTAQKPAQKKLRTAQKEKCAEELVDDDGLTDQQRLFVAEYLKDNNATQAAIRAGYSKKTAEQIGYQLLQKTSVAQAIAQFGIDVKDCGNLQGPDNPWTTAVNGFRHLPEVVEWNQR